LPEEIAGLTDFELMLPDELDQAANGLALLAKGPLECVYRMRAKSGEYLWTTTHLEIIGNMILAVGNAMPWRMQGFSLQPGESLAG
jgi:hypothetical protein